MSKHVNLPTGNYSIKVRKGGTIFLDAPRRPESLDENGQIIPAEYGTVVVTGNLEVRGDTTTVSTSNMLLEDNILQLNVATESNGTLSSLNQNSIVSGLEVNLGAGYAPIQWVYTGSTIYNDPASGTIKNGVWGARLADGANTVTGIETVSITTPGTDLNLLGGSTPSLGVVTVNGTVGYEDRVLLANHIPNKKYVDDEIQSRVEATRQPRIQDGTFEQQETYVETQDDTSTSVSSRVIVGVDGIITTYFYDDYTTIFDVRISGNVISSLSNTQRLVLSTPRYTGVDVDDSLTLTPTLSHIPVDEPTYNPVIEPIRPSEGTKLYAKIEGPGGTGLYFVNQQVVEDVNGTSTVVKSSNRDELISKNKAILYSMIF
jgi:hypothetical protein